MQLPGVPHLLQAALIEDGDAISQAHGLLLIVGDVQDRMAGATEKPPEFGAELLPQLSVKVAHRFIEKHDPRLSQQGASQGNPLALATRKLGGAALAQVMKLKKRQDAGQSLLSLQGGHTADLQSEGEVVGNVEMGIEGIALEHHPHATPRGIQSADVLSIKDNPTGGQGIKTSDDPQRGGLAAAARPQQGDALSFLHVQMKIVQEGATAHLAAHTVEVKTLHPLTAPWVSPLMIQR
jgi:hypothetical protein